MDLTSEFCLFFSSSFLFREEIKIKSWTKLVLNESSVRHLCNVKKRNCFFSPIRNGKNKKKEHKTKKLSYKFRIIGTRIFFFFLSANNSCFADNLIGNFFFSRCKFIDIFINIKVTVHQKNVYSKN